MGYCRDDFLSIDDKFDCHQILFSFILSTFNSFSFLHASDYFMFKSTDGGVHLYARIKLLFSVTVYDRSNKKETITIS